MSKKPYLVNVFPVCIGASRRPAATFPQQSNECLRSDTETLYRDTVVAMFSNMGLPST